MSARAIVIHEIRSEPLADMVIIHISTLDIISVTEDA